VAEWVWAQVSLFRAGRLVAVPVPPHEHAHAHDRDHAH
ncbi:MAG: hypothetical protein QOF12_2356, partial [Solirubrobacteraceae bacterium]|nr:hypothetical protein [Solirubrobacteraceae bacterium]